MSDVHVVEWDRATLSACADEVLDVYAEAMQVSRLLASGRRSTRPPMSSSPGR